LEFLRAYFDARDTAFTTINIITAFKSTGIQPFNRVIVLDKLPADPEPDPLNDTPDTQLLETLRTYNPETPKTARQLSEHLSWVSNKLQSASQFETPTRKCVLQKEKAYIGIQSRLLIAKVTVDR
jgi:hypothetical protein